MQVSVDKRPIETIETEALVIFVGEGEKPAGVDAELFASGEVSGKALELTLLHHPAGFKAKRVLLAGLGKNGGDRRKAAGAAVRYLKARSIREAVFAVGAADAEAVVEGAILGDYDPDIYRSDSKPEKAMDRIAVAGGAG